MTLRKKRSKCDFWNNGITSRKRRRQGKLPGQRQEARTENIRKQTFSHQRAAAASNLRARTKKMNDVRPSWTPKKDIESCEVGSRVPEKVRLNQSGKI